MKERIVQLLDLEQLTPSKFADIIGVQRSSVSHVISGRNNPSFDFIQKTLNAFPGLNAEWLILGKGTMYEQMGRRRTGNLFDAEDSVEEGAEVPRGQQTESTDHQVLPEKDPFPETVDAKDSDDSGEHADHSAEDRAEVSRTAAGSSVPGGSGAPLSARDTDMKRSSGKERLAEKRITRVILFYDDDTFVSFDPS